ncbi:hypothetical protein FC52_GL001770 [Lactobacillus pasteurii DSM 23907 = CRBIP 24.76]|nr:hypothetical protein FC52_GL001770 [Lactobacillus pasteurii DSM 23907 = CRBIP 24.76]
MSPESFAQIRYNNMMFNDAGSNWGHRDDLLSKTHPYSEIAVSVGFVKVNGRTWACLVANLYW